MTQTAKPPNTGNDRKKITVNNEPVTIHDDLVDTRKVLQKAGFNPSSDHLLVQLLRPGSVARDLDEEIDLSEPRHYEFRAFLFDRALNFTVDEVGYAWGAAKISVDDLYDITGVDQRKVFFLEREDEPDLILEPGDELDLDARGVEHLRSGKRHVTVTYNHQPFELERRVYTTEELRAAFAVENGYILDLIAPNGEFRELKPNAKLKVRDGMEFVSHAPCGQSS